MKKRVLVAVGGLFAMLILVAAGGPLWVKMGMRLYYIQTDRGHIRLIRGSVDPASLPALKPGVAPIRAADALPLIIDTDMAADDWMAILYLLQRADVDVRAITVVGTGETHCRPGVRNALNLAALAGRAELPVACGRETPLGGGHEFPMAWRERVDNLLELRLPTNVNTPPAESAVELIARLARESSRRVHLLALGPLTNVAEALMADPALANKLEMITIMGGAVNAPGNTRAALDGGNEWAEWNIYADPRAAALVLASGAPITLVPLDATQYAPATLDFYMRLERARKTPSAEFVYRVLAQKESDVRAGGYYFWDALAAAIVTDASLATYQTLPLAVVDQEGPQSGRAMVSDGDHTVRVATGADQARFEALFLDTLNGRVP